MAALGNKYEMGVCHFPRFIRSSLVAIIVVLFFHPTALLAAVKTPAKCKSVSLILENQSVCHGHFVRLTGRVVDIKRTGKWTKFQLSDDASKLNVFNFGDLFGDQPIKNGDCVLVEGVYYFRSTQVDTHHFNNEIRWEKVEPKPKSCSRSARKKNQSSTVKGGKQDGWDWRLLAVIGVAVILVLASLGRVVLVPRRYRRMGKEFEEYVVSLFPSVEWEIEDRSSDTSHTMGRRVVGDVSYDWIVRHRATSRRFILQCKFRSRYYRSGIEWAKMYQMRNYGDFQRRKGWDYFVILGVGGAPKQPSHLYLVPLQCLGSPFVLQSALQSYARDPHTPFTLDDQGKLA